MLTVNRALALGGLLVSTGALAMDSNIHIAFPLGTNQVTSNDVRIVQSPPTQVEVPSGFKAGLRFGVNIKGYVGVEFDIDAQGWDLFKEERGGLGFVGGGLRLHPVQIAQHWKPVLKEREWDLSLAYLTGWHLLGQQADGGWGRAYEGSYNQFEVAVEYYVTDLFTLGLELPWRLPSYDPHIYSNYEEGRGFCFEQRAGEAMFIFNDPVERCAGRTAPTATIFSPSISLNFRIPLVKRVARRAAKPYREE